MQLHTVKVRLAGSLANEVRLTDVTPAEIILLRDVHGGADAVADIQRTRSDTRPHELERQRLAEKYGIARVQRLFGPSHNLLPDKVPGLAQAEDDEGEEAPRRGAKTTRKSRKAEDASPEADPQAHAGSFGELEDLAG